MRSSNTAVVGIHDARIDVAEALQVEQRGGVRGVFEDVRGGLINGHGARAGFGVRPLSGVQRARGEAEGAVGSGHLSNLA